MFRLCCCEPSTFSRHIPTVCRPFQEGEEKANGAAGVLGSRALFAPDFFPLLPPPLFLSSTPPLPLSSIPTHLLHRRPLRPADRQPGGHPALGRSGARRGPCGRDLKVTGRDGEGGGEARWCGRHPSLALRPTHAPGLRRICERKGRLRNIPHTLVIKLSCFLHHRNTNLIILCSVGWFLFSEFDLVFIDCKCTVLLTPHIKSDEEQPGR